MYLNIIILHIITHDNNEAQLLGYIYMQTRYTQRQDNLNDGNISKIQSTRTLTFPEIFKIYIFYI